MLSVDLGAIRDNWGFLKSKLKSGCECSAVVKADAYGLGARQVAPALYEAGCRWFFTATLDEALGLRRVLSADAKIAVLHGVARGEEKTYIREKLVPVLNHMEELERWRKAGKNLPAIAHIDTGMNRLGFSGQELEKFCEDRARGLDLLYIMSHLAAADEKDHPKNQAQFLAFQKLLKSFPGVKASFASSSGIFLGTDMHFDLVRPGAALYGINPVSDVTNPMRSVITAEAEILQIRSVSKDENVGYGASFTARAPMRVATLGIGYADGYFRALGGKGKVVIGGVMAPVVGRVSMDLLTVDVSAVPEGQLALGQSAELVGSRYTVDDMARDAGTIGYEVLTALGRRFVRRYIG